jgi:cobalt-zinc-cadmium efflux system outer membrane protein
LFVADDIDTTAAPSITATDDLVARDPGVKMATGELDAARLAAEAEHQATRPEVTLGIEAGRTRHDIPAGAFASAPTLIGSWSEWEVALSLSVPLPIFDRNRVARATANADVLAAAARLIRMRADVRRNIIEAQGRLAAAIDAVNAAAEIPQIIERESQLLDKALRVGGIELASFAQQAHRLMEVGRVYDDTVLALHRARAAWVRLAVR